MTTIKIAPGYELPETAVTTSFALLAMKGAGKSNAAVVLAEKLYDRHIPWVAIDPKGDWWGIRAGTKPLEVPIFGGLHGDVPLDPTAGPQLAELIVEKRLTALIDTSELTKGESIRLLDAFFDRLYRLKNRAPYPMHLFLEEGDDYVPQKVFAEVAKLVRTVELVVKRGRARGLGITLATQRAASINKDVLTQTDVLVALRNTSPQDRKAIEAWLSWHGSSREISEALPRLQNGEAWVSWPEHGLLLLVKYPRRRTFDSGATPTAGQERAATLADIDLEAVSAAFTAQIERAKADDPKTLRARIAELERAVSARAVERPVEVERIVEVDRIVEKVPVEAVEALEATLGTYDEALTELRAARDSVADCLKDLSNRAPVPAPASGARRLPARAGGARSEEVARAEVASRPQRSFTPAPSTGESVKLKAGAQRMLNVLQNFDEPLTKSQLSTLAQVTKGGTFSDYLSALRQGGYIVEEDDTIRIGPAHRLAQRGPLPTPKQIAAMYEPRLKAGARRMLAVLMAEYPGEVTRSELSERADVTKGGTFSDYVSSLRSVGLAQTHGQHVRAGEALYIGRR